MEHKYKYLTEEDLEYLKSVKPYELIKFDLVLDAISRGDSILEKIESDLNIYFDDSRKLYLRGILMRHGYEMEEMIVHRISKKL